MKAVLVEQFGVEHLAVAEVADTTAGQVKSRPHGGGGHH
jgi:hypothetical protein